MIKALLLIFCSFILSGCSGFGRYCGNRFMDATDMVTCSAGEGTGLKVRASAFCLGAYCGMDEFGLRSGNILLLDKECVDICTPVNILKNTDWDGIYNYEEISSASDYGLEEYNDPRGKTFVAKGSKFPFYATAKNSLEYYTNCEVALGVIVNVRLGVNAGEILDFILGWVNIDIYADDAITKRGQSTRLSASDFLKKVSGMGVEGAGSGLKNQD